MGVKTTITNDSIKIIGNPNLKINKKIIIKKYLKDHRVFMTSVIAALVFGGNWTIYDKDLYNTLRDKYNSKFPSLFDKLKK